MPAIGAFEKFTGLNDMLDESYYRVDDREVTYSLVTTSLFGIVSKVERGELNKYVGREVFRQRIEQIEQEYGFLLTDIIDWNDVSDGTVDEFFESYFDYHIWWEIYSDDADIFSKVLDLYEKFPAPDPYTMVEMLSEVVSGFLAFSSASTGWVYVMKSDFVRNCLLDSGHDMNDVCKAEFDGDTPAYVLSDEDIAMALELEEMYQKVVRRMAL